jgi:hypothetical protein
MRKTLDFIDGGDDPGNLFVVYYAGHGRMNSTRQAEWVSYQGPNCSSLDWSGIQTLFAGAKSEVLILLDTCAAASSAATSQFGIMETIAACGFESRAAPPGEFSFTNALIEIMRDWISKPSFSVSILHTEILFQLKKKDNKRGREGTKLEWCSSPIYLRYTQDSRSPGIELYRRTSPVTPEAVPVMVPRPTTYTHATEVNLENPNRKISPFYSLSQDKRYRVPRVLISISLEEDQPQLDSENCTRWFANMPFLAADVEVFPSCSTLMIMSIPLPVWNMFPDHPACSFIGYVTAPKLKNTGFPREICDSEVTEIKQETTTASSHDDTDGKVAASQWKPEVSLQPDLVQLKREPHVTTEKRSLAESGRSTPTKESYFQWTSPFPSLGTSIFAKPAFADVEVPTLKELEEKRYTELKNIEVEEWRSTCGSSDPGDDLFPGSRPLDPTEGNEIQPVDDAASTRNNKISEDETYYNIPKAAVEFNEADLGVIVRRQWTAAPTIAHMTFTQYQPPTANEAINIYKENADMYSLTSRRASWGTQRGSETALAEIEPNAASGNFLKRFLLKKSGDPQKSRRSTIFDTGLSLLSNIVHKNGRRDAKLKVVRSSPHQGKPQSLSPQISSVSPWKPKLPTIQTSSAAMSGPPVAAVGAREFDDNDLEESIDEELDSGDGCESMEVDKAEQEEIVPTLSNSATPSYKISSTPGESLSEYSNYQPSELGEIDDPFFGVNFDAGVQQIDPLPSILPGHEEFRPLNHPLPDLSPHLEEKPQSEAYPLSPVHSSHTPSPRESSTDLKGKAIVSQHELLSDLYPLRFQTLNSRASMNPSTIQLTPDHSGHSHTSAEGLEPSNIRPEFMVSQYGHAWPLYYSSDLSGAESAHASILRTKDGPSQSSMKIGQAGLNPELRMEIPTLKEHEAQRLREEKNIEIEEWIAQAKNSSDKYVVSTPPSFPPNNQDWYQQPDFAYRRAVEEEDNGIPPLDDDVTITKSENKLVEGQTYYNPKHGIPNEADVQLMQQSRHWHDAPSVPYITTNEFPSAPHNSESQPPTSMDAIKQWNFNADTWSIASYAATWGTRRRSEPSLADFEAIADGSFLKKLSINKPKDENQLRQNSLFDQGLDRLANIVRKRTDTKLKGVDGGYVTPKRQTPSINTAFAAVAGPLASAGMTHARVGSPGLILSEPMSVHQVDEPTFPLTAPPTCRTCGKPGIRSKAHPSNNIGKAERWYYM